MTPSLQRLPMLRRAPMMRRSATDRERTMRIGFVGTGTMGTPIARCLIEAGHELTVYDRHLPATETLRGLGARLGEHPRAVAELSEAVFTSLPGPAEAEAVAFDAETGILAGLDRGTTYIDLTTSTPDLARRIAKAGEARGAVFLDAPVSGRPPGMTVMVGGEQSAFDRYRVLFETIAQNVFFVGPSGSGCAAKLVTQYLGYSNLIAALEGMLIGAKAGLDLEVLAKIVPVSAGASRTFDNIPRSVFSREFTAGGTLDIVAKDMALACELAREVGAPASLGLHAADIFRRAQAQGWNKEGFPVAVRILEAMAGAELRADAVAVAPYSGDDPRREGRKP
jgi:3-hydroxyisobutyrate dehydrogenase-like beta-hydroxyacid dehydrogenase